jgi:hypothetical protein
MEKVLAKMWEIASVQSSSQLGGTVPVQRVVQFKWNSLTAK